jgi:hypothetical protein
MLPTQSVEFHSFRQPGLQVNTQEIYIVFLGNHHNMVETMFQCIIYTEFHQEFFTRAKTVELFQFSISAAFPGGH